MHNDPELDPKFLGTISSDFVKVADLLKEAGYQMKKREISEYPIFPISKTEIPIGSKLYDIGQMENSFHYYISLLEEFMQRELVSNAEEFKASYKNPEEFCCLFVVDQSFTNFVFIPYPED